MRQSIFLNLLLSTAVVAFCPPETNSFHYSARPLLAASENLTANERYVDTLLTTLESTLDKWIINGSSNTQSSAYNVLKLIETHAQNTDQYDKAVRMARRAGLPAPDSQLGATDEQQRRSQAKSREDWEEERQRKESETHNKAQVLDSRFEVPGDLKDEQPKAPEPSADAMRQGSIEAAKAVSLAGKNFDGSALGIGGLDDVLAQLKRRVWTPLAVPPEVLEELGIQSVRGVLLFGKPGCGKTLLARQIGRLLSPMRPITVVSGPEILEKFVGSSEKNLRDIFDNPPDIYDAYRIGKSDGGEAMARQALHVVVMDEFDAIARARGGRGSGTQGDAGVARDSVVNQLLAKMDGVDPLPVRTLVIGLTNKRSLLDPALLRPGRFEVQIEVPPPRTKEERMSILRVHTGQMFRSGRLIVSDAPAGSVAECHIAVSTPAYEQLLAEIAGLCDGFSGALIAGVVRAAASYALERSVEHDVDCVVSLDDMRQAAEDLAGSYAASDTSSDESNDVDKGTTTTTS